MRPPAIWPRCSISRSQPTSLRPTGLSLPSRRRPANRLPLAALHPCRPSKSSPGDRSLRSPEPTASRPSKSRAEQTATKGSSMRLAIHQLRRWTAPGLFAAVALTTLGAAMPASTVSGRVLPPIRHIFIISIENKGFTETYGAASTAPYLSKTLTSQGVLLSQYYGIGHESNDNYLAEISGQGPNADTQADCQSYTNFVQTTTAAPGQAVGQGCVFPANVRTVADQLQAARLSWKGYMEDMGNNPAREPTTCAHPAIG